MSARKDRPAYGTLVTAGMSMRDIAACLNTNTARLYNYMKVASIPDNEFERLVESDNPPTTQQLFAIASGKPVRARGRVERAAAIIRNMTAIERSELLDLLQLGGNHG